jgi:hypothetical protein
LSITAENPRGNEGVEGFLLILQGAAELVVLLQDLVELDHLELEPVALLLRGGEPLAHLCRTGGFVSVFRDRFLEVVRGLHEGAHHHHRPALDRRDRTGLEKGDPDEEPDEGDQENEIESAHFESKGSGGTAPGGQCRT